MNCDLSHLLFIEVLKQMEIINKLENVLTTLGSSQSPEFQLMLSNTIYVIKQVDQDEIANVVRQMLDLANSLSMSAQYFQTKQQQQQTGPDQGIEEPEPMIHYQHNPEHHHRQLQPIQINQQQQQQSQSTQQQTPRKSPTQPKKPTLTRKRQPKSTTKVVQNQRQRSEQTSPRSPEGLKLSEQEKKRDNQTMEKPLLQHAKSIKLSPSQQRRIHLEQSDRPMLSQQLEPSDMSKTLTSSQPNSLKQTCISDFFKPNESF